MKSFATFTKKIELGEPRLSKRLAVAGFNLFVVGKIFVLVNSLFGSDNVQKNFSFIKSSILASIILGLSTIVAVLSLVTSNKDWKVGFESATKNFVITLLHLSLAYLNMSISTPYILNPFISSFPGSTLIGGAIFFIILLVIAGNCLAGAVNLILGLSKSITTIYGE